eukprot:scaffold314_cov68-Skeletonema_menzelii.AAC.1
MSKYVTTRMSNIIRRVSFNTIPNQAMSVCCKARPFSLFSIVRVKYCILLTISSNSHPNHRLRHAFLPPRNAQATFKLLNLEWYEDELQRVVLNCIDLN